MLTPRLHLIMADKRALIVEMFVSEVRVFRLPTSDMTNADIAYGVDDYLSALIQALAEGRREAPVAVHAAVEHARQRARFGYDLRALLTEVGILRTTIVEVASLDGGGLTVDDWERLMDLMHQSLVEAASRLAMPATRAAANITQPSVPMAMRGRS
jgi:hypothetical protein